MSDLAQRIETLERENRRWKRGAGLVVLGALALAIMGQAPPAPTRRVVEAEQFVLKGPAGERRAALETRGDGTFLVIYRPNGAVTRALVGVHRDGTALVSVYEPTGKSRGVLAALGQSGAVLTLSDQQGRNRLALSVGADDSAELGAWSSDGKQVWKAP